VSESSFIAAKIRLPRTQDLEKKLALIYDVFSGSQSSVVTHLSICTPEVAVAVRRLPLEAGSKRLCHDWYPAGFFFDVRTGLQPLIRPGHR
jgi:hypothetical protein